MADSLRRPGSVVEVTVVHDDGCPCPDTQNEDDCVCDPAIEARRIR